MSNAGLGGGYGKRPWYFMEDDGAGKRRCGIGLGRARGCWIGVVIWAWWRRRTGLGTCGVDRRRSMAVEEETWWRGWVFMAGLQFLLFSGLFLLFLPFAVVFFLACSFDREKSSGRFVKMVMP
jgi:hypothetical protein